MMLWFVLITVIAAEPTITGTPKYVPGDVIQSSLIGAADTREKCEKGGEFLAVELRKAAQGSAIVVATCVQMLEEVGDFQGFVPMEQVPHE